MCRSDHFLVSLFGPYMFHSWFQLSFRFLAHETQYRTRIKVVNLQQRKQLQFSWRGYYVTMLENVCSSRNSDSRAYDICCCFWLLIFIHFDLAYIFTIFSQRFRTPQRDFRTCLNASMRGLASGGQQRLCFCEGVRLTRVTQALFCQ